MSSESRLLAALVVAVSSSLAGCADFSRGDPGPVVDAGTGAGEGGPGGGGAVDGPVSFSSSVHALMMSSCQGCHSAGGQASSSQFILTGDVAADYTSTVRLVDTSTPASSRLLSKASGSGHGGGAVFAAGSPEYQTVLQWIQQGAPQ